MDSKQDVFCRKKYLSNRTAAAAKSLQSCPTLCDPIDGGPPGSPVPGILQARTLEWVAISFSNAWKWKVKVRSFSRVRLLATPWTAAYQAPPSMGFSRQEYWSGVPLPSPATLGGKKGSGKKKKKVGKGESFSSGFIQVVKKQLLVLLLENTRWQVCKLFWGEYITQLQNLTKTTQN